LAGLVATAPAARWLPARASGSASIGIQLPVASFTAVDYGFLGPATLPAGFLRFELINRGMRAHMLGIITLANGKTVTDLLADTRAKPTGPTPSYVTFLGGPDAVDAGGLSVAIVNLSAGEYAVVCTMPDADSGATHLARGMVRRFLVTGPGSQAQAPVADLDLEAGEFDYYLGAPVAAGPRTIHLHNTGLQQHEAQLARLPEGISVDQYIALNDATNASQGSSAGGSAAIPAGADDYFTANFTAGRYGLVCFATDAATGKAHFELGQILEFTVA
jgi:hypothetical protein